MPDAPILDQLIVARAMDELDVTSLQAGVVSVYVDPRPLELRAEALGAALCEHRHHDVQCEREAGRDGPCVALMIFY